MKIKVNVNENNKIEYPCLERFMSSGLIVLFSAPKTGTVMNPGSSGWHIGMHSHDWNEENAEIFQGTVTLSND